MFSLNKSKVFANRPASIARTKISGGVSTGIYNTGTNFQTEMLEGFIDDASEEAVRNLYNEIYYYDGVSGPAADIKANLPWSDYNLLGVNDKAILDICNECLEELNIESLMKRLSTNYLIQGILVGSLIFNKNRGIFSDLLLHDINSLDITPIPLVGYDPKIDLKVSPEFKKFLKSRDDRDKEAFKEISPELVSKMMSGSTIPLEPISTLFICKNYIPNTPYMSYFTRVLPIWLIEKALMRGTIIGAWKRQRSILHVKCLTGDTLVSTEKGLLRIDEIIQHNPEEFNGKQVTYPLDMKVKGYDGKFHTAKFWHYRGFKETITLKTKEGRSISCTPDHKFLTLGDEGLKWEKAINLEGKVVCIENKGRSFKKSNLLNLEDYTSSKPWKLNNPCIKPKIMTTDLAYLMGMLSGDGNNTGKGVHFESTVKESIEEINDRFENVFGEELEIKEVETKGEIEFNNVKYKTKPYIYKATLNSVELSDWLNQLGIRDYSYYKELSNETKPKSKSVKIPSIIFNSNKKFKYAFIAGYLDADGSIVKTNDSTNSVEITFFSSSKEMLFGLQIMLSDLGFISRIDEQLDRLIISPYSEEVVGKQKGIPSSVVIDILENRKTKEVPNHVKKQVYGKYYFFNDENDIIETTYPYGKLFDHYKNDHTYFLYSKFNNREYDKELQLISEVSGYLYNKVEELLTLGYNFEEVVSIEENGKQHVYDLTMTSKTKPAFTANSIVAHNCGNEEWEPTDEQLQAITELFIGADQDPQGSVVVTRPGIESEEVRDGNNFWKVSDEWDIFANAKMRALGINEGLLSMENSYNNAEQALTIFLEDLVNFRSYLTNEVIYNKIFLTLAKYHGWKDRTQAELKHNVRLDSKSSKTKTNIYSFKNVANAGEYLVPTIHWTKELTTKSDDNLFDKLAQLEEKGIPIPVSMYSTAAGVNIDDIIDSMKQDLEVRIKLNKYQELLKKKGLDNSDEYENDSMYSSFNGVTSSRDKDFIKNAPKESLISKKLADSLIEKVNLLQ